MRFRKIFTCIIFYMALMVSIQVNAATDSDRINALEAKIQANEERYSSASVALSTTLTAASLVATVAGLGLAIFGLININRADKIVERKIKQKMEEFNSFMAESFSKSEEATQKMIAGYLQQEKGKVDDAISLYKSAIDKFPKIYNGYSALGYAYQQKGNNVEALLAFNKAAETFPHRIESFNDLARVNAILHNREGCIENLRKMAQMDKGSISHVTEDPVFNGVIDVDEIKEIFS